MEGLFTNLTSHVILMLYSMVKGVLKEIYIFADCSIKEFSAAYNNLTCMCPISEACDDDE